MPAGPPWMDEMPIRHRMLAQIVAKLAAGREVKAREGQVYGSPRGQRIASWIIRYSG
jgi:hypothetical protein